MSKKTMCLAWAFAMSAAASLAPSARALDDDDNDYQIPAGYEERRHPIGGLLERPENFQLGAASFNVGSVATLNPQNVLDIVRNCVAPETWTKRGPARIEITGGWYL